MIHTKTHKYSVTPEQVTEVASQLKLVYVDLDKRDFSVDATGSVSDDVPMVCL